jgi:hypothetical protein
MNIEHHRFEILAYITHPVRTIPQVLYRHEHSSDITKRTTVVFL